MFKKIILAFKFSSGCRSALEKAIQLAVENDAELLIFHALDYRLSDLHQQSPERADITERMKQKFDSEIKPALMEFQKFTFNCQPTDPGLEICKIARETNADLILVGCHDEPGRESITRLDYVGMTILEKAPCPIMLVPS